MYNQSQKVLLPVGALLLLCLASCIASPAPDMGGHQAASLGLSQLESPSYRVISDQDQSAMLQIKREISQDFSEFKNINEVHTFLDQVKLLVQKHPKNIAFAQGDLKELLKFLSQEIITKLIRVDTEPFVMPLLQEDKLALAQRAVEEDDLTRKLFGAPLRSLVEQRKQQTRIDDGNHKDGNVFSNFWCRLTGCHN